MLRFWRYGELNKCDVGGCRLERVLRWEGRWASSVWEVESEDEEKAGGGMDGCPLLLLVGLTVGMERK